MSQKIPVLDYLVFKKDPAKFVQHLKDAAGQWGKVPLRQVGSKTRANNDPRFLFPQKSSCAPERS